MYASLLHPLIRPQSKQYIKRDPSLASITYQEPVPNCCSESRLELSFINRPSNFSLVHWLRCYYKIRRTIDTSTGSTGSTVRTSGSINPLKTSANESQSLGHKKREGTKISFVFFFIISQFETLFTVYTI
jgi:hypothetical protein